MNGKWIMYALIFVISLFFKSHAVHRGGSSKSRVGTHSYSSGTLSNESPQDPGRAILAIIFMILSCCGGIGWKIYRCYKKITRRKYLPPQIPYPNNIYINPLSTSQFNESDLPTKRFPSVSLSVQSWRDPSEKVIDSNILEDRKYSIIVPSEDINKSSHTTSIGILL